MKPQGSESGQSCSLPCSRAQEKAGTYELPSKSLMVETVTTYRVYKNYKKAISILFLRKGLAAKPQGALNSSLLSPLSNWDHRHAPLPRALLSSCRSEASFSNRVQYKNIVIEGIAKAFKILQHPFLI